MLLEASPTALSSDFSWKWRNLECSPSRWDTSWNPSEFHGEIVRCFIWSSLELNASNNNHKSSSKKLQTELIWWSLKENESWTHRSFKTNHLISSAGEMNCMLLASILLHQDSIKLGSAGAIIHYLSTYPSKPARKWQFAGIYVTSNPTNSRQVHLGTSK